MINKEKLIKWCWENLQFYNAPKNWKETYIIDILSGCNGICHKVDSTVITYSKIRSMFEED